LRVARKHGIIYHGQGTIAEVKKLSGLGSTVLKSNDRSTPRLVCPKISIIGSSKTKKVINPQIYPLFFSSSIDKHTYKGPKKKAA
jgi:hypothetical protein